MKKSHLLPLLLTLALLATLLTACGVKITALSLPQDVVLARGETLQLTPDYTPQATAEQAKIDEAAAKLTVTWTTADETVVTVNETGLVTAVGAGEADVTANAGDGLSAVTHVKVVVPPTGVTAPAALDLVTNGQNTQSLNAAMQPADATEVKLAYTSSDDTVATVDENGTVTAVGNGTCTITTYLTADLPAATGETADAAFGVVPDGLSAVTRVTVTTAAESIALDKTEGVLYVGGTVQVTAAVLPDTVSDPALTWSSSDETVAAVDAAGNITAKAPGSCTVTAAAQNGITADYALTVIQKPVATPRPTAAPAPAAAAPAAPQPEQPAAPAATPQPAQDQPAQSGGDNSVESWYGEIPHDPNGQPGSGIDWTQDSSTAGNPNATCGNCD